VGRFREKNLRISIEKEGKKGIVNFECRGYIWSVKIDLLNISELVKKNHQKGWKKSGYPESFSHPSKSRISLANWVDCPLDRKNEMKKVSIGLFSES
jgi:hypothetical protein